MEPYFQINWSALIEEARQRRKTLKLTQQRLALLAGVSTPTVGRFENGSKDIQLSSVINLLNVLGLIDHRQLIFTKSKFYDDARNSLIWFDGKAGEQNIVCAISYEALGNYFSQNKQAPIKIFARNHLYIEQKARCKYLAGNLELDGSVLIKGSDF